MSYRASVIIERDKLGFFAYCPELEGCHSEGASMEEALANIREAIDLYLSTLSEAERKVFLNTEITTTVLEVRGE